MSFAKTLKSNVFNASWSEHGVYQGDILGHVSVQTAEIYARADSKQKREAIEKACVDVVPKEELFWKNNDNLLSWLMNF